MNEQIMYYIAKLLLTFASTLFIFNSLQAVDLSKIFKPNSTGQIKLLVTVSSFVLGYLFANAIVSLFEDMFALI